MPVTNSSPIEDLKLLPEVVTICHRVQITTVGKLLKRSRVGIAHNFPHLAKYLDVLDNALTRNGLAWPDERGAVNRCKTCPPCPECGGPLARDARNVVQGANGGYRHGGFTYRNEPCGTCHEHHAALFAAASSA